MLANNAHFRSESFPILERSEKWLENIQSGHACIGKLQYESKWKIYKPNGYCIVFARDWYTLGLT